MSDINLTNITYGSAAVYNLSTRIVVSKPNNEQPVSLPPLRNSLLNFDHKAKEIILLSTAFATMLLSMCFLVFIGWFCCATIYKERPTSCKKLRKAINETRNNIQLKPFRTKKCDAIYVRDGSEYASKASKNAKPSEDTISYHAYDILDVPERYSPGTEKTKKEEFKKKLNNQLSKGNLNVGFVHDETKRYISPNKTNFSLAKKNSGRVDKNSTLRNRPKLTREQIEREFYQYTIECRQKLNDLFSPTSTDSKESDVENLKNEYNSLKSKFKRPCLSVCNKKEKNSQQIWQI